MAGYTKLFSEIITSTIWREDDKTRIVWITLLALADKYGNVNASVPGLVVLANVERKKCEGALRKLKSPDLDSRTRDYDGRRIEDIDGGWHILNYAKYRNKMRSAERTEYLRIKQAEHRAKKNKTVDVNILNHSQPIAEAEAEAIEHSSLGVNVKERTHSNIRVNGRIEYDSSFSAFWIIYPKKAGKGAAHKSWKKLTIGRITTEDTFSCRTAKKVERLAEGRWTICPESSDLAKSRSLGR